MPKVNISLMRETLEYVTANPEALDQANWGVRGSCGTTHCFAGWTVVREGYAPLWKDSAWRYEQMVMEYCLRPAGVPIRVMDAARELLGLTQKQAYHMFTECGDLDALWQAAKSFTDGAITGPRGG